MLRRIATKLNTIWLGTTYPFKGFDRCVSIDFTCDIARHSAQYIDVGAEVYLAPDVWLNIVSENEGSDAKLVIGRGCRIGRRCTISAKNYIELGKDILLAPSVLIMDHNHQYRDVNAPIHAQGTTGGGRIIIGKNCWLGYGSVVCCGRGELMIGQNCVVGANSVVTTSFPPFSVIAGNPARLIRRYDTSSKMWQRVEGGEAKESTLTVKSDGE